MNFNAANNVGVCNPSPCGPNSQCHESNKQAACSCMPTFIGSPPACRPECTVSTECTTNRACINRKCSDPCPGVCGLNSQCVVKNHSPICICKAGLTGDPFTTCFDIPCEYGNIFYVFELQKNQFLLLKNLNIIVLPDSPVVADPCVPSPCGLFSTCRNIGGISECSCINDYIGSPPNCHPECTINSECTSNMACLRQKCRDPCPGSCGLNAYCTVINHIPRCTCTEGFSGNPFRSCIPPRKICLFFQL